MKFSKEVEIDATPKRVWEVMEDLVAWPNWTPTIGKIELLDKKPVGVGSRLRIEQPRLPRAIWEISKWKPYEGFVMEKGNMFLKITLLHDLAPAFNGTRVVLSIVFSGLFASPIGRKYGPMMEEYLSKEVDGLKKESEAFSHKFELK